MVEVFRIVENQTTTYAAAATEDSIAKSKQLEILLQRSSESLRKKYAEWDKLIRGPFLYPIPVAFQYQARFKPPGSDKTVFYGSKEIDTALYEHAYHFIQERLHLKRSDNGQRAIFSTNLNDKKELRIHKNKKIKAIMSPIDYSASHTFINKHLDSQVICYPSCRDPKTADCYAVFNIELLDKSLKSNKTITYIWDAKTGELYWQDYDLIVSKNSFGYLLNSPIAKKIVSRKIIKKKIKI